MLIVAATMYSRMLALSGVPNDFGEWTAQTEIESRVRRFGPSVARSSPTTRARAVRTRPRSVVTLLIGYRNLASRHSLMAAPGLGEELCSCPDNALEKCRDGRYKWGSGTKRDVPLSARQISAVDDNRTFAAGRMKPHVRSSSRRMAILTGMVGAKHTQLGGIVQSRSSQVAFKWQGHSTHTSTNSRSMAKS